MAHMNCVTSNVEVFERMGWFDIRSTSQFNFIPARPVTEMEHDDNHGYITMRGSRRHAAAFVATIIMIDLQSVRQTNLHT